MKTTKNLLVGAIAIAIAGMAGGCARMNAPALADCSGAADPPAAIAKCTEVIESKQASEHDRAVALVYRASALEGSGQHAGALADSDAAVRLAPDLAMTYTNRGAIHSMQGNPEAAARDLDAALKLDPKNAIALGNRAILHSKQGEWEQASALIDRSLEADPESPNARGERCWISAAGSADPGLAIPECDKAIELNPNPNNFNSRGMAYFRAGQYAKAIADYDHSIEGDPTSGSSFYIRGLAKQAAGIEGAQADIDKGLELEPGVRERYVRVGILAE